MKAAQGQEELHADMYASQQVLMEYSQHGLTDACSKILTQAGVQQQGLAALSQAFKQAATIREVRSRRQALLKVFKRILTEATSQHEKNDKSRGRSATQAGEVAKDAPANANRHPKHEDSCLQAYMATHRRAEATAFACEVGSAQERV